MKEDTKRENDWEGFEHFPDVAETNHTCLPEINRLKTSSHKTENPYNVSPKKNSANQQRINLNKRSDPPN